MFDFTTETVLNDLSGVSVVEYAQDKFVPEGDKALDIKRLNKYLASGVDKVYKTLGTNPVNEVVEITLPATQTAGTYRLELDVQTSGAYPITHDRWAINKGKPYFVEVAVATDQATAANLATALLPGLKRGLIKNNGQAIKDIVITANAGKIVVTASNEYFRFRGATITKLDATGQDFLPIGATFAVTTPGKEGFGTAWFITKNLRLPTQEATRFGGEGADERPTAGVLYNQYAFQYEAARNFTGSGAVGQKVESKTTHVLFVPSTLATAFEASLTSAFGAGSIINAHTKAVVNGL